MAAEKKLKLVFDWSHQGEISTLNCSNIYYKFGKVNKRFYLYKAAFLTPTSKYRPP